MSDRYLSLPLRVAAVAGGTAEHAIWPEWRDGWVTFCGRAVVTGVVNRIEDRAAWLNTMFACRRCAALVKKHNYREATNSTWSR